MPPPSSEIIPSFAVLGVVNEGKTSVVATLSEDPDVTPDATPGATVVCQAFPIRIDGREVLRLYDTPGFQNAVRALAWCREHEELPPGTDLLAAFREAHRADPDFRNEVELFRPVVEDGAGILYVVDGSSPVTDSYRAEMELLWRSGRPRMALINHKDADDDHTPDWERVLGRYFNQTRRFNAHRATHADRLDLLRDLQHMDGRREWQDGFARVLRAFEQRWESRRREAAGVLLRLLEEALTHMERANYTDEHELPALRERLGASYREAVRRIERAAHERLKEIYRHPAELEELDAVARLDLFQETTWQTLGLTGPQLVWAAAVVGALAGGALDVFTAGHTLLLGAGFGGALGAGAALVAGKRLGRVTFDYPGVLGRFGTRGRLGGSQVQASCRDVNFPFVLLDRALLLHAALVRRAHARRDPIRADGAGVAGVTHTWPAERRARCLRFAESLRGGWRPWQAEDHGERTRREFFDEVFATLREMEPAGS